MTSEALCKTGCTVPIKIGFVVAAAWKKKHFVKSLAINITFFEQNDL